MKLAGARWAGFVRQPNPDITAVLLFGTEPGTVHQRALDLVGAWLAGNDDPFAVTRLSAQDLTGQPDRIAEAACQASLLGGNRVVHLSGISDQHAGAITAAVEEPARIANLVIEAGNLTPRSKLRQAFEASDSRAAAGCYPLEGRALADHISRRLTDQQVSADGETLIFIAERLTDNLGQIDQEIDKLALLAGPGGHLDLDLVGLSLGDTADAKLDALVQSVTNGDLPGCEKTLSRLFAANQSSVGLVRVMLRHLARLHQARCMMDRGQPADRAASSLSPPVMARQKSEFVRQINRLDCSILETIMGMLTDTERACKKTGIPAMAVAGQSLLTSTRLIARQSNRRAVAARSS